LPAEQYAIKNNTHPAISTQENIDYFKSQLLNLGLSYDWSREVQTNSPDYYKRTQWIFLKLYNHYYDIDANKACPIDDLIKQFKTN
jgi:leucyl-tRNA synthetase